MSTPDVRNLFPDATISDRAALALFAWHGLLSSGHPGATLKGPEMAFAAADNMLRELARQERWRVAPDWPGV